MKELFEYLVEVLICGGVFMLFFRLLLYGKVPFGLQRWYLLLTVAVSALIPLLRIPVYAAQTVVVEPLPIVEAIVVDDYQVVEHQLDWQTIFWIACFVCFVVMIAVSAVDLIRIARLRRNADRTVERGVKIYESRLIKTPFSFLRSIYLCGGLTGGEREQVVAHELSHIRHHHSEERLAMNVLRSVEWFNPFVWIAHRYLNEVHEYQADADLLAAGYDIDGYRQLILKQLLGYNPDISCGLNNSLTKKRFIMMTKKIKGRHALLRVAAVVPALCALTVVFGFTAKPTIFVTAPTIPNEVVVEPAQAIVSEYESSAVQERQNKKMITVNGTVMGDNGPLVGALVTVEQSKEGVVTDKEGKFTIKVANGCTLKISFTGYQTNTLNVESTGKELSLGIILNSLPIEKPSVTVVGRGGKELPKTMDEIVVVGYGQMPEEEGAVRLDKLTGEKQLLYIVDGIRTENITSISPDQIESVTILKGDKAMALYGQEGENGVILVATKAAQKSSGEPQNDKDQPFLVVDQMPSFNGGSWDNFRRWVMQQLRYPTKAQQANIEGKVVVRFVVERDGKVGDVKIMQSPNQLLSDEVIRVVESSPLWVAGEQNGEKVRVAVAVPIEFKLSPDNDSTAAAKPSTPRDKDAPYLFVEQMPTFNGGTLDDFRKWAMQQLRYPAEAQKANIEGKVVAQFVVDCEGKVVDVVIVQSPSQILSDEVTRVLKSSPAWTSGSQRGEKVKVKYTLPLDFKLQRAADKKQAISVISAER